MIPQNVKQFTTEGERQTYIFLETVAKPDNRFICWYLPDVQGKEPDFLLFSAKTGLVILEVKDWNLEQIREATPQRFLVDIRGKVEPRQNPLKQARDYEENGWKKEQIKNLTYVAITRARYQLFIPYIRRSPLISKLQSCL